MKTSRIWTLTAGVLAALVVIVAVVAFSWPRIEQANYRRRFRAGYPEALDVVDEIVALDASYKIRLLIDLMNDAEDSRKGDALASYPQAGVLICLERDAIPGLVAKLSASDENSRNGRLLETLNHVLTNQDFGGYQASLTNKWSRGNIREYIHRRWERETESGAQR